ncbi:MAG: Trk system potassium transporter TrkA, partial [Ruminococcus sp.]|nr:Trk system potassium transporter TrkA [Ruminococcus sp.]
NDGKAEVLEFRVKKSGRITGTTLLNLDFKDDLQIACITRKGKMIIPKGTDTIEVDDTVIVVTKHKGLSRLEDILR